MADSIEAVLFDLGGVFTDSPFAAAEALGRDLGAEPGCVMTIVFGPYHSDTDHPWHRLERGELTVEDANAEISALGRKEGLDIDLFKVLGALSVGGVVRQPLVDKVRSLRGRGYRTGLVTNNVREFSEVWRNMIPIDEIFEVVVDSCEIGIRKPDPAIFRHALALLGNVAAERVVFLDDLASNISAARALGIHGILVGTDPSVALAQLDALLEGALV